MQFRARARDFLSLVSYSLFLVPLPIARTSTQMNPETCARLSGISTATLCTALFKRGLRNQFVQDVRPLNANLPIMVGPAFTPALHPAREIRNTIKVRLKHRSYWAARGRRDSLRRRGVGHGQRRAGVYPPNHPDHAPDGGVRAGHLTRLRFPENAGWSNKASSPT